MQVLGGKVAVFGQDVNTGATTVSALFSAVQSPSITMNSGTLNAKLSNYYSSGSSQIPYVLYSTNALSVSGMSTTGITTASNYYRLSSSGTNGVIYKSGSSYLALNKGEEKSGTNWN